MLASSLWGSFNYLGFLVLLSSLLKLFSVHDILGPEWSHNAGNRISELSDFENVPGGVYPRTPLMILSLQLQMAWSINVNTVAMALSFNFQIQDVV